MKSLSAHRQEIAQAARVGFVARRAGASEPHTRLKQASLFSPTRLAILDAIRKQPGCNMSEVARRIGRHPSGVYEHLRHLRKAGLVLVEGNGKRVALYLNGELTAEERLAAKLGPAAAVLEKIREGVSSPALIAYELGLTRHSVRYQLKRLQNLGLVRSVEAKVLVSRTRFLPMEE